MSSVQVTPGVWSFDDAPVPLQQVRVDGAIQHLTAHLNVMLTYRLDAAAPSECAFRFPLYDLGLVTAFEASIGGAKGFTLVKSKVRPKADVERALKAAGHEGFAVDESLALHSTDLFVCRLGALQPGAMIRIKISFLTDLLVVGERLALVLPPSIVPKAYVHEGAEPRLPPFALQIDIATTMFEPVRRVTSPVHPVAWQGASGKKQREGKIVTVAPNPRTTPNVDDTDVAIFIDLEKSISAALPLAALEVPADQSKSNSIIAVAMRPVFDLPDPIKIDYGSSEEDEEDEEGDPEPRDILFVVDPAAVDAAPVEEVRHTLLEALEDIKDNHQVHFNVLVVSARQSTLFRKSAVADSEHIAEAVAYINSSKFADEYAASPVPLKKSLTRISELDVVSEEIPRVIFLLTQGQISRPSDLLGFVDQNMRDFTIFPIGLGNASNLYILKSLANLSGGAFEIAFKNKNEAADSTKSLLSEIAHRQIRRILQPPLDQVSVDWGALHKAGVVQTPIALEPFYSGGTPFPFFASTPTMSIPRAPFTITLKASSKSLGELSYTHSIDLHAAGVKVKDLGLVRLREIAERLIQLEMLTEDGGAMAEQAAKDALELAMEANVACTDTGFFANETDEKTGTSVLLASVTDLAEADRPVRRYDIKYLMEFQAHFTDKPTLPDMPWDKLPISRTAPELTSTPDKRSKKGRHKQKGAAAGGVAHPRTKKLEVKTQWADESQVAVFDGLLREFNTTLNKITRDNFDRLVVKLVSFSDRITEPAALQGVVELVFEKALQAPRFASLFADLCVIFSSDLPKFGEEGAPKVDFRRLLLTRCQIEFEKVQEGDEKKEVEKEDEEKKEEETEGGEKALEKTVDAEELAEKQLRRRLRMAGNITFVGELFKNRMIGVNIVHYVIDLLLQPRDGGLPAVEDLELVCKFVPTVGEVLDQVNEESRQKVDAYFTRMRELSENEDLELRVRFLLKDVLEMREKGWIGRTDKITPKTIEEVHKMAAQRRLEKSQEVARLEKEQGSSRGGRGGRRDGPSPLKSSRGGRERGRDKRDLAKSGGSGRGGSPKDGKRGMTTSGGWSERGGRSGGPTSPRGGDRGLSTSGKLGRGRGGKGAANGAPASKGLAGGTSGNIYSSLLDIEDDTEEEEDENEIGEVEDPAPSAEASPTKAPQDAQPQQEATGVPSKETERKFKGRVDEFVDSEEDDDLVDFLAQQAPKPRAILLASLVLRLLDAKERERKLLLSVLKSLMTTHELIDLDLWQETCAQVLPQMADIVMDNPNALKTFAHMLAVSVCVDTLSPSALLSLLEKSAEDFPSAAKLAALTMAAYVQEASAEQAKEKFAEFDLSVLLPEGKRTADDVKALLTSHPEVQTIVL